MNLIVDSREFCYEKCNDDSMMLMNMMYSDNSGTLLAKAIETGNRNLFKRLLECPDVDVKDGNLLSLAIKEAIKNNDLELVKLLVQRGVKIRWILYDINFKNAVKEGKVELVEFLLKERDKTGSDNYRKGDLEILLDLAKTAGQEVMERLLEREIEQEKKK